MGLCSHPVIYLQPIYGGKGEVKAVYCHPVYAEYIMRNAGLDEAQAGIKILGEIAITSDVQMTPPLWQKIKKN